MDPRAEVLGVVGERYSGLNQGSSLNVRMKQNFLDEAYRNLSRRHICAARVLFRFESHDRKLNLSALIVPGKFEGVEIRHFVATSRTL